MSEPSVVPPGGGEIIGDSPERRVEILSDADALHATWTRYAPHREGADLHVHRRHTDLFYVLEGELTVRLGPQGEPTAVPAGTLVRVPPLVVHGFRNDADAELRYLNFHAPGQDFANYLRGLRDGRTLVYDQEDPPQDGGRPATEAQIGGDGFEADLPGRRVRLLADVDAIAVAETRLGPRDREPLHVHRRHAECLYVLEGEPMLVAGDKELTATPGWWVRIPPGVPHALAAPAPVRLLELHTPSWGFGAFVRAVSESGDDQAAAGTGFDQQP